MSLVLKKWTSGSTADNNGNYVHLIGRQPGFFAWLLSIMGVDPTTEIEVKQHLIVFTVGSLSGRERRVIPLRSVSSTYYGYEKPWKEALALALVLLPAFGLGLLIGPLYYILNKKLTVGVVEVSGWAGGFSIKRSVIEGKNIQEPEAYQVIEVIRGLIEAKTA
jgi:hypothetical protein